VTLSFSPLSLAEVHRRRAALRVEWDLPRVDPERVEVEALDEPEVLR
jgi:hypothetical protein